MSTVKVVCAFLCFKVEIKYDRSIFLRHTRNRNIADQALTSRRFYLIFYKEANHKVKERFDNIADYVQSFYYQACSL